MNGRNSVIRTADALSLAAWFGGSLMGAAGLPRAAERAADGGPDGGSRVDVEGAAWSAWQPVQATAIAVQLLSGAALTVANGGRVLGQRGVGRLSLARTALTGAALGATVLAARAGRQLEEETRPGPAADGDGQRHGGKKGKKGKHASDAVAAAPPELERRTRALQWAVPALTGGLLAIDAVMGEQQRPNQVARGTLQRILPEPVAHALAS